FCNGCGGRLDESARSAARDRRAYTPKHLVEKILASRTALEGERKQVTVLFADVKGSMDLAEQIDPEMFHQVMERVAALLAEGVHRFEGTVTQFTGDGLMALFGAPIAHEDHAQRACFAALHLSEELRRYAEELKRTKGLGFAVRMGINSGEVVVGTIGDDLRMDYTAQEPPVLRVRAALPRAGAGRLRGARRGAREGDPLLDAAGVPTRLLRHQRAGPPAGDAREGRRQGPVARPRADRRVAAPLRSPRRARPRAAGAPHGPGGPPAPDLRRHTAPDARPEPAGAGRVGDRRPALDRRRERGVPRGLRRDVT